MKIQFSCPSCGAKYQADSQLSGKTGKCKHCGSPVEVPEIIHDTESATSTDMAVVSDHQSEPPKRKAFKTLKVSAIMFVIITVLGVGAKYGYDYYRIFQLKQKLEEAIRKNTGYTETILKVEAEAAGMTYKEKIDLCEKSIENRTNLIIELRGLYPDIDYELKEELIDFLNHENELISSKRSFYRHQLTDSRLNMEILTEYASDQFSSSYGAEYYRKRTNKWKRKQIDSMTKIVTSADNFKSNYLKLVEQESTLRSSMNTEGILFPTIIMQYKYSNLKRADESKSMGEELLRDLQRNSSDLQDFLSLDQLIDQLEKEFLE